MKIRKEVLCSKGFAIPRFYGLAWSNDLGMIMVCYPIPLNLIMRWLNVLFIKIKFPHSGVLEKFINKTYNDAFDLGYSRGWNDKAGTFINNNSTITMTYAENNSNPAID